MNLTLKTNRLEIIKFLMPIFVILSALFVLMIVAFFISYEDMEENVVVCIVIGAMELLYIAVFLCLRFIGIKTYTLTSEKILVYSKKKQTEQFDVENIIFMKYRKFHIRYLITVLLGELRDGGCWQLYVYLTNGEKIRLATFTAKEIAQVKALYGELVQVQ